MSGTTKQTMTGGPAALCSACRAWLCAAEDAYCGGCGRPCARIVLEALPAVLPLGNKFLPKVPIKITNPALVPLKVKRVTAPPWLNVARPDEFTIAPHSSDSLWARADTSALRNAESGELTVQTNIGDASILVMANPEVPVLVVSPELMEYWPDVRSNLREREYEIECYPPAGHMRIHDVRGPEDEWLKLQTKLKKPDLISRESPLKLQLQFDPQRAPRPSKAASQKLDSYITLIYETQHSPEPVRIKVTIEPHRPPELTWVGEDAAPRELKGTSGQTLSFIFTNALDTDAMGGRQNARLRLLSADLLPPEPYKEAGVQCLTPLPLEIAGSDKATLEFQLNLQAFSPKIYHFSLVVTANRRELNRTYTVPLQVRALQPFNGIAAIDFGTSNTCFALLPTGGDLEMMPIDERKITAPTLVRYLDLSGPEPRIQTGSRIKELAAEEEKVASSTVSRLKQRLGEDTFPLHVRPANSSLWVTREARQAAADYLRHIRSVGEKLRGVLFTEFILTHPAVCSLQQYRNLRVALEDAFGKNSKIHFLQEPIASLVPFFREISANGAKPSYTVAAFDLGGGTTDITVVAVQQTAGEAMPRKISPEIIASWGEKFGGEDLTDFLAGEVKHRCQQILADKHSSYKLADTEVSGSPRPSIRRNESALREWVEEFKASISEERGAPELRASLFLSVVPDDRNQPPRNLELNTSEIRGLGDSLEDVLSQYLAGWLQKLAIRLKDSIKDLPGLDYIHLSGKTSFLKEVRHVLEQQFPEAEIKRATDPKECVVRGACMWRSLQRGRKLRLVLPPSIRRTTSQIGVLDEMDDFVAGLRLDQEIPDSGLEGTLRGAWDGQDRIVLWENLGVENRRFFSDRSLNPLITMLGTWEAATAVPPEVDSWDLRLHLQTDFTLQVTAVSGERSIECRPFGLRGDQ